MIVRGIVSLCLVLSYFLLPKYGFTAEMDVCHYLYPLSHANIWHLAANIMCLWMIKTDLNLVPSYTIAVMCSYLPCFVSEPTMGFSGILFAIVGISWGRVGRFKEMILRNKWFLIIPVFIPHVNAFIHLYCMLLGYLFGVYYPQRKYWL